uniref:Hydroxymethylglutaryl-CoA synthase n=1 Tax=Arundo donax TaxID=35708 RepID=A0A0A8ZV59_ARUDO
MKDGIHSVCQTLQTYWMFPINWGQDMWFHRKNLSRH